MEIMQETAGPEVAKNLIRKGNISVAQTAATWESDDDEDVPLVQHLNSTSSDGDDDFVDLEQKKHGLANLRDQMIQARELIIDLSNILGRQDDQLDDLSSSVQTTVGFSNDAVKELTVAEAAHRRRRRLRIILVCIFLVVLVLVYVVFIA
eukprot:Trichotokara_eunicae@DN4407_c0_g1_i2.p1